MTNRISSNKHSSIRIEGERILYFDPFEIEEESHDADLIFVTHEHFDHLDAASIEKIKKQDTILIAPLTIREKLAGIGVEKQVLLAPWEETVIEGITVQAIPAYNEGRPFHTKERSWIGYVVTMGEERIYVAGDTDANADTKTVKCDIALVPVGGKYTMDVPGAVSLIAAILPKVAIPTHYGAVAGSPEDGQRFCEAVKTAAPQTEVRLLY